MLNPSKTEILNTHPKHQRKSLQTLTLMLPPQPPKKERTRRTKNPRKRRKTLPNRMRPMLRSSPKISRKVMERRRARGKKAKEILTRFLSSLLFTEGKRTVFSGLVLLLF